MYKNCRIQFLNRIPCQIPATEDQLYHCKRKPTRNDVHPVRCYFGKIAHSERGMKGKDLFTLDDRLRLRL